MKGLLWIGVLALTWTANAEDLRDPTRPPLLEHQRVAFQESAPTLSAVLNFNGERSAIFNGHLVHGGSNVGGYTILAVLADGVLYRHAGQSQELHLPHPTSSLKKPSVDVLRASSGAP